MYRISEKWCKHGYKAEYAIEIITCLLIFILSFFLINKTIAIFPVKVLYHLQEIYTKNHHNQPFGNKKDKYIERTKRQKMN